MSPEATFVRIPPNRGPRRAWRCSARNEHGQRCRFRGDHEGLCRAFGHDFAGRPKPVRRQAARKRKAAA